MSTQTVRRTALLNRVTRRLQRLAGHAARPNGLLQPAQAWEAQYAAGRWDYLAQLSELARFSILAGYVHHLRPGGAVLGAGCGQGALLRRLPSSCYSRYVGIDVSSSAISVAREYQSERSSFLVTACEEYSPPEPFDVIFSMKCCLVCVIHWASWSAM